MEHFLQDRISRCHQFDRILFAGYMGGDLRAHYAGEGR